MVIRFIKFYFKATMWGYRQTISKSANSSSLKFIAVLLPDGTKN